MIRLEDIVGFEVKDIGRCLNLFWIDFTHNQIDYSLHVQCAWRLITNNTVRLSNIDLYEDDGKRFDLERQKLHMNKVTWVEISEYNDIKIKIDDNTYLDIFVNDYDECWRFFKKGNIELEQFVVYANRADYE